MFLNQKNDPSLRNLTIPQALIATNNLFQELEYCSIRGSIVKNLSKFIYSAISHNYFFSRKQIFFLLIMVERCVVLVYQKSGNIIALLDSHRHHQYGEFLFKIINIQKSFLAYPIYLLYFKLLF